MSILSLLLILIILVGVPSQASSQTSVLNPGRSIAIITTRGPNDVFWGVVEDILEAACKAYNMKLRRYYAHSNRINMLKALEQEASRVDRADIIVFPNYLKTAASMIKKAEDMHQPIFIFNSGVSAENSQDIGAPREKYRFFIGQILPDDKHAGYLLTQILHTKALQHDNSPTMIAISGNSADTAAIERNQGLKQYLGTYKNLKLAKVVTANWEKERAENLFTKLYKRHPEALIAWSASDHMAIGIRDAKDRLNNNQPLYIGGIDWSQESIAAVKNGTQTTSIGGHVFEGVWIAALIHDYFVGKDFADISLSFQSPMSAITTDNVEQYQQLLDAANWHKLDFGRFSRALSGAKTYQFSLEILQQQLSGQPDHSENKTNNLK
jgi:ABC-type sugar transport system substrate-binding protein